MLKKILIGGVGVALVVALVLFFWARAMFSGDGVRNAVAAEMTAALGQPVTIGRVGATIYPRVTMTLDDVRIGNPARIQIGSLHVGTDFRALLSRRIEQAAIRLHGARIELPLPEFTISTTLANGTLDANPPVEIVSVAEIALSAVEIVSGDRVLKGDVLVVPENEGLTVKNIALQAGETSLVITGRIDDTSGPTGELAVTARGLNFDQVLAFVSDFAKAAGGSSPAGGRLRAPGSSATPSPALSAVADTIPMDLRMVIDADAATFGDLRLERVAGRIRVTPDAMTFDPVSFGMFGGQYQGVLALALGTVPQFTMRGTMSNLDMGALMRFAEKPGVMTGRLTTRVELTGDVAGAASVMRTTHGTARVTVTDGTVKSLGLLRTIVIATSMRTDSATSARSASTTDAFSRLTATLSLARGIATTKDLHFESPDLTLSSAGALALDGSRIDLRGRVQLSDALSARAGRDLVRYTADDGRVTLPARVTGSADNPSVQVDVASALKRAIINRGAEELKKGLGRVLGR